MNICPCGKAGWPDKATADAVVVNAKIRLHLHGNQKRRETRTYRCPDRPGWWHVTSQPDLTIREEAS